MVTGREEIAEERYIPIDIYIRRTTDDAVRVYSPSDWGWHDDGGDYQWTDGNFGCDCNRYLFFQRAADEDEAEEYPCGQTLYRVRIVERGTARVLFCDDERERAS